MKLPEDLTSNKKKLILLIGVIVVLVTVVYFNFILVPQVTWVIKSVMNMGKANSELSSARADITKIGKLKDGMVLLEEKVDKYEKMLPAEQEIPSLLENLSVMARNSGIKIVGIVPIERKDEKVDKNRIYKEIPILISAKSGYHELGRFLSNLENADRFMKVADIDIKSNAASPKKHDVELMVLTYALLRAK